MLTNSHIVGGGEEEGREGRRTRKGGRKREREI